MDIDEIHKPIRTHDTALKYVVDKEIKEHLAAAIGDLRKQYRDVVHLRHFERKSYTEIASLNQCTPQQARVRFFRAKQSLRNRLCEVDYELD
jgi:RNA polymerase sigma factor (sigma-70 family)